MVIVNRWKFFIGACILTASLLHSAGAPTGPVLVGFLLGGVLNWVRLRYISGEQQ
jgi:hypothetical protein